MLRSKWEIIQKPYLLAYHLVVIHFHLIPFAKFSLPIITFLFSTALSTCCSGFAWNGKHTGQKQRRHDWHKTGKASGATSQWRRLLLLIPHGIFNFSPEAHCFGPLTLSLTAVWIAPPGVAQSSGPVLAHLLRNRAAIWPTPSKLKEDLICSRRDTHKGRVTHTKNSKTSFKMHGSPSSEAYKLCWGQATWVQSGLYFFPSVRP